MAYALQSMLRIRTMREDRAATELSTAQREVSRAQEALDRCRCDFAEYEATKEERRDKIYEAVLGRAVSMDDLDLAREGVSRIDEEGTVMEDTEFLLIYTLETMPGISPGIFPVGLSTHA